MTEIDFYTHVADKDSVVCTLCAKALAREMRIVIYTVDATATERIDRLLWHSPPTGFLPHCRSDHALVAVTPVVIAHNDDLIDHDDILLSLTPQLPPFFSRFRRLIEIVGLDEEDRQAARERYSFYRDRGYTLRSHNLGKRSTSRGG